MQLWPRTREFGPRIQDLEDEVQNPQNRTNDLELTMEKIRPRAQTWDMIYVIMVWLLIYALFGYSLHE